MNIRDRFNHFALRIQDSLSAMRSRDRKLVLLLTTVVLLCCIGGSMWWMRSSVRSLATRVESREDALRRAQIMAMEYTNSLTTAEEIEAKLAEHHSTNLSAFLEKAATAAGIRDRLDRVQEKTSSIEGDLELTQYSAELSKLTLEEATNFLYEMESAGFPLKVRSAKFKTRKYKGEKTLRLTLDIAAYKKTAETVQGGEG